MSVTGGKVLVVSSGVVDSTVSLLFELAFGVSVSLGNLLLVSGGVVARQCKIKPSRLPLILKPFPTLLGSPIDTCLTLPPIPASCISNSTLLLKRIKPLAPSNWQVMFAEKLRP